MKFATVFKFNKNHDPKSGEFSSTGGSPAGKYAITPDDGKPLPPIPGEAPIPDGSIRMFHQTSEASAITEGMSGIEARQPVEGPWGVWGGQPAGEKGRLKGFYGEASKHATVEYAVPRVDFIDGKTGSPQTSLPLQRNVKASEVLAVHLPWHARARYIEDNPATLAKALAGEFDDLGNIGGSEGKEYADAVKYVKNKHKSK